MANSQLQNKQINIPQNILDILSKNLSQFPNGNGFDRAKNLVNQKQISYENMKRIKNFFDGQTDKNTPEYNLAGGDLMKNWIENQLNSMRGSINTSKSIKSDFSIKNQYKKTHDKDMNANPTRPSNVSEKITKNNLFKLINEELIKLKN